MPAAPFIFPTSSSSPWWRCCLGLLVLACLLRAWLPVGYMPAVVQGSLVLSVCSGHQPGAGLVQSVEVDYQGDDLESLECPYAVLVTQAMALPGQPALPGLPGFRRHLLHAPGQLPLARAPPPGPPLGSRAPPLSFDL